MSNGSITEEKFRDGLASGKLDVPAEAILAPSAGHVLLTELEAEEMRTLLSRVREKRIEHSSAIMELQDRIDRLESEIRRHNEMHNLRLQEIAKSHGLPEGQWDLDYEKGTFVRK